MPELPEVETVRRGLAEHVVGNKFKEITVLHRRATSPKSIAALSSLKGARVTEVARRGKFLWFKLDRPEVLVGHLGMSGQFLIQPRNAPDERHLRVKINLGKHDLRFIDQRTFGWLGVDETRNGLPTYVKDIAADPFDSQFNLDETIERFKKKKTEIKRALLDQGVMSGVGNIYADEALWRSKIHPESRTETMKVLRIKELIENATNTGGTWVNHPDPNSFMQYNITESATTGGNTLLSGFVINGSGALVDLDIRAALQLGRSGIGTISDTYTLACASPNANKKALAVLNWIEQR